MTENQRWRLWAGIVVGGVVLKTAGMADAVATRSRAGVALVFAFGPVFAVAVVARSLWARRGSGPLFLGDLHGLEPRQRRIVVATVYRGTCADDPVLRLVVAAHAQRQRTTCLRPLRWVWCSPALGCEIWRPAPS